MRLLSPAALGFVLAFALLPLCAAGRAQAADNDLVLSRFATPSWDTQGNPKPIALDTNALTKFRSLASELGVVLAPHLLMPSDTLGFSGFNFSLDFAFTEITAGAPYWDAARRVDPAARNANRPPGFMPTAGAFVRKGIWFPLPSFELGAGVVNLLDSNMWALQFYGKLALQEGFHGWLLPSLAVRGSASQVLGARDLDLTVAGLDVSISKSFGIARTWRLHPYAGWNLLFIIPRAEVLDATPYCDAFRPSAQGSDPMHMCPMSGSGDLNSNFVFPTQSVIVRHRIFVGAKAKFHILALTVEWQYAIAGGSADDNTPGGAVKDGSGGQNTVSISAAMDF